MRAKNIKLTSLTEDFKAIRLLQEDDALGMDSSAPAAVGSVAPEMAPEKSPKMIQKAKFGKPAAPTVAPSPAVESVQPKRVSALIQEAKSVLEAAKQEEAFDLADVIRGYANVALIADTISQKFAAFAESNEYDDDATRRLATLSDSFAALAEDTSNSALELASVNESDGEADLDGDLVAEDFQQVMEALLDGLDVYSKLTEDEEDGDEEEEEPEEGEKKMAPPEEGKDD